MPLFLDKITAIAFFPQKASKLLQTVQSSQVLPIKLGPTPWDWCGYQQLARSWKLVLLYYFWWSLLWWYANLTLVHCEKAMKLCQIAIVNVTVFVVNVTVFVVTFTICSSSWLLLQHREAISQDHDGAMLMESDNRLLIAHTFSYHR